VHDVAAGRLDVEVRLVEGLFLEGTVVDRNGDAVKAPGSSVYVVRTGTTFGGTSSLFAPIDEAGAFRAGPLPGDATYDLVTIGFAGYARARLDQVRLQDGPVTIRLERAGRIRGRVVKEDGSPAPPNVRVVAWTEDRKQVQASATSARASSRWTG
jgi:hypothetical protein